MCPLFDNGSYLKNSGIKKNKGYDAGRACGETQCEQGGGMSEGGDYRERDELVGVKFNYYLLSPVGN